MFWWSLTVFYRLISEGRLGFLPRSTQMQNISVSFSPSLTWPLSFSVLLSLPVLLRRGRERACWWAPHRQPRSTCHASNPLQRPSSIQRHSHLHLSNLLYWTCGKCCVCMPVPAYISCPIKLLATSLHKFLHHVESRHVRLLTTPHSLESVRECEDDPCHKSWPDGLVHFILVQKETQQLLLQITPS